MCYIQLILTFALFCTSSVLCNKLCNVRDSKCMTKSAERIFVDVINGIPGVDTSDPLHLDLLEANIPKLKYKLIDGSLSGMKKCHMEFLQFRPEVKRCSAHIGCPHLILESGYEIKGYLGAEFVEGNGTFKVDYYNYTLLFDSDYERKDYDDRKFHIHLISFILELEARGKVHYDFTNLFNGDRVKSDAFHEYANENWQLVDKMIRQPTMEAFMDKYIKNINGFFKKVPVENVFTTE